MLAWHVDYWDYLGWKDPFGAKEHSERQRSYLPRLRMRSRVTPQLLVANEKRTVDWRDLIGKESKKAARVLIDADLEVRKGKLAAAISLDDADPPLSDGAVVRPVLFQRKATTKVRKGENRGRELVEYFVVRELHAPLSAKKAEGKKGVRATFDLPAKVTRENLALAVLVEDPKKMTTFECADFDLPAEGERK